ncbi:MAG: precorrin-3B C(17)-methyltransferase [Lachnospiraceae bacterium]|nr:precorrin-3B C(17)-methyltransferase [Lachnospiraceae bacterium]
MRKGKLYIIGIGPGNSDELTFRAVKALKDSGIICGYDKYIGFIRDSFSGKEFYSTPMKQETERCLYAIGKASDEGKTVSIVSGGDPGVYGMAGLVYELLERDDKDTEVEVIPGISASLAGGAVLGAPLMNDFVTISLSDQLTPWEVIERRLNAAGMGDFTVCIYNPMSHLRRDNLKKACDILLKYKDKNTVCGYVRNIGREGESSRLISLSELRDEELDMSSTVFIGEAGTRIINGKMVTERGYGIEG